MGLSENETYRAALREIFSELDLTFLQNRTVMVTGASGMLGSCLVDALELWNEEQSAPCRILAVSRNSKTAEERFPVFWDRQDFAFLQWDVSALSKDDFGNVDYIVHAASNADPVRMAKYPVDTLTANVLGTKNLLDYGLSHGMKRFLFVSSGEVYGQPGADPGGFTEDYCGALDLSDPRSCYPSGKRAAEVLCQSYIRQYGADTVIVRPCHLFGPTMTRRDSRAVSEFLRNAADGRDIVMKSAGLPERSHCYVIDAARALLTVLLNGERGQAYNIADPRYQMRIRDFAQRAAEAGGCQIVLENPNELEQAGYSQRARAVLDASKLEKLGWMPARRNNSAIRETVDILRALQERG